MQKNTIKYMLLDLSNNVDFFLNKIASHYQNKIFLSSFFRNYKPVFVSLKSYLNSQG